jgi:hypothetical protein
MYEPNTRRPARAWAPSVSIVRGELSVAGVRVEHEVKFADFIKCLDSFATRRERPLPESFNPRNASFTIGADFPGPLHR